MASFSLFITGLATKVFAMEPKYGIFEPEPTVGERIWSVGKIAIPIILFFIEIFVILSKKISKKAKIITVASLVLCYTVLYLVINYIMNNV